MHHLQFPLFFPVHQQLAMFCRGFLLCAYAIPPQELMRDPDKRIMNTYVILVHLLHRSENKHSVLAKYTHSYMSQVSSYSAFVSHSSIMGRQTGPLGSGGAGDFSNETTKRKSELQT